MNSTRKLGHLAGVLWLLSTIAGGWGMTYIRSNILVAGDAAATAAHIITSESAFRAAIVGGLLSQVCLFFFGLVLFQLFRETSRLLANILLTAILVTVAIAVVNVLNLWGALLVLTPTDYLKAFSQDQLNALAMTLLRLNNGLGQALVELFWTPYFLAFGLLVLKSRLLPKILGILLLLMSAGFAANTFTKFLCPHFYPGFFTQLAMLLGALGGIPTMLWLLIRGARQPVMEG